MSYKRENISRTTITKIKTWVEKQKFNVKWEKAMTRLYTFKKHKSDSNTWEVIKLHS